MVHNTVVCGTDVSGRFAPPPWTMNSGPWRRIDARLAEGHLARQIDKGVELLDLTPLFASYLRVGKEAVRPDLMLKLVLYEKQTKRPSPSQWARDVKENEAVRWLTFGLEPSRTLLYQFRDQIGPHLDFWNQQVLQLARDRRLTTAKRASLDGSSVTANASRKLLANEARCQKRIEQLDEAIAANAQGSSCEKPPYWMAETSRGRFAQRERYERVRQCLRQRHEEKASRRTEDRKTSEKILVSWSDPESVFGRDKLKVNRPLYNVQLLRDLDSPLILAHDVFARNTDFGTIPRLMELAGDFIGCMPETLLTDSGYVSIRDLEFCESHHITLYAPYKENDHSAKRKKKNTQIPKSQFTWLEDAQTYRCPEGHLLRYTRRIAAPRFGHEVVTLFFVCPVEHCNACKRRKECTTSRKTGRQVRRMEKEELLDELIQRMKTDEAKTLYKLRCRTVELNFADMKEHRGIRRFSCRGLSSVRNDVAATVLVHNLITVLKAIALPTVAPSPAKNSDCDKNAPLACFV